MKSIYRVAELYLRMEPRFEPLISRSEPYRTFDEPRDLLEISVTPETYASYHRKYPDATDPLIEYMETGSVFYRSLISHAGILLHSSAVVLDGKAYLFSAPSGTGKSTHTRLWLQEFPGAEILNDDKPAIRVLDDGIYVYGTPWSGKTDQSLNRKVPLQGIAFLERSEKNSIGKISDMRALASLLNQTIRPGDRTSADKLLDLLSVLIQRVPMYRFCCNMEKDAAHLSYNTMSKGIIK